MTNVDKVVRAGLCSGCGLCASLAPPGSIEMSLDAAGFYRPHVVKELSPSQRTIFADVCPGIKVSQNENSSNYHHLWGPLISVRTGYSIDDETRRMGSSGGVVSAVAIFLLDAKYVDFVAQIAVSSNNPLMNELQISTTKADVLRASGSRYSPSAPLARLESLLAKGKKFAFIGKPCDIAALRRYGNHDIRVGQLIPLMISFMCAGVPSHNGTLALLGKMGVKRDDLASFRYRGDGWPGKTRAVTVNGQIIETDYNTSWGTVLNRHLQFRCKICPDGTGEFADIVCADAWYGKDGYPDFAERDGRSLILCRTQSGEALVNEMTMQEYVATEVLSVDEIETMQPYQANRKRLVLSRLLALYIALRPSPSFSGLHLWRCAAQAGIIKQVKSVLGTLRRLPTNQYKNGRSSFEEH